MPLKTEKYDPITAAAGFSGGPYLSYALKRFSSAIGGVKRLFHNFASVGVQQATPTRWRTFPFTAANGGPPEPNALILDQCGAGIHLHGSSTLTIFQQCFPPFSKAIAIAVALWFEIKSWRVFCAIDYLATLCTSRDGEKGFSRKPIRVARTTPWCGERVVRVSDMTALDARRDHLDFIVKFLPLFRATDVGDNQVEGLFRLYQLNPSIRVAASVPDLIAGTAQHGSDEPPHPPFRVFDKKSGLIPFPVGTGPNPVNRSPRSVCGGLHFVHI